MCDFNEGIEVLQSVASLWNGGKKVVVREATGTYSTVHMVYIQIKIYFLCFLIFIFYVI